MNELIQQRKKNYDWLDVFHNCNDLQIEEEEAILLGSNSFIFFVGIYDANTHSNSVFTLNPPHPYESDETIYVGDNINIKPNDTGVKLFSNRELDLSDCEDLKGVNTQAGN